MTRIFPDINVYENERFETVLANFLHLMGGAIPSFIKKVTTNKTHTCFVCDEEIKEGSVNVWAATYNFVAGRGNFNRRNKGGHFTAYICWDCNEYFTIKCNEIMNFKKIKRMEKSKLEWRDPDFKEEDYYAA